MSVMFMSVSCSCPSTVMAIGTSCTDSVRLVAVTTTSSRVSCASAGGAIKTTLEILQAAATAAAIGFRSGRLLVPVAVDGFLVIFNSSRLDYSGFDFRRREAPDAPFVDLPRHRSDRLLLYSCPGYLGA